MQNNYSTISHLTAGIYVMMPKVEESFIILLMLTQLKPSIRIISFVWISLSLAWKIYQIICADVGAAMTP